MENPADSKECKTVKVEHTDEGLHLRAEVIHGGNVLAARDETISQKGFMNFSKEVRTDFPVKQADGSSKWYEEFPTKTDAVSGKSLLKENELYKYDPKTDKRAEPINKDSAEYNQRDTGGAQSKVYS